MALIFWISMGTGEFLERSPDDREVAGATGHSIMAQTSASFLTVITWL